jgi:hypothetical protein
LKDRLSGRGGIGRRKGLKTPFASASAGSSPAARTKIAIRIMTLIDDEKISAELDEVNIAFMMIRAHLWAEYVLITLLEEALHNPECIDLDRLAFIQKVNWCAGLNLMPVAAAEPLRILNNIRNKCAHKLDYIITSEDLTSLENSLSDNARGVFRDELSKGDDTERNRAKHLCRVVIFLTEMYREDYVNSVKAKQAAHDRLRAVLDKIKGVGPPKS